VDYKCCVQSRVERRQNMVARFADGGDRLKRDHGQDARVQFGELLNQPAGISSQKCCQPALRFRLRPSAGKRLGPLVRSTSFRRCS